MHGDGGGGGGGEGGGGGGGGAYLDRLLWDVLLRWWWGWILCVAIPGRGRARWRPHLGLRLQLQLLWGCQPSRLDALHSTGPARWHAGRVHGRRGWAGRRLGRPPGHTYTSHHSAFSTYTFQLKSGSMCMTGRDWLCQQPLGHLGLRQLMERQSGRLDGLHSIGPASCHAVAVDRLVGACSENLFKHKSQRRARSGRLRS